MIIESHNDRGLEKGFKWLRDKDGNLYACHISDMPDPEHISDEDLNKYCMSEAKMGVNIGD